MGEGFSQSQLSLGDAGEGHGPLSPGGEGSEEAGEGVGVVNPRPQSPPGCRLREKRAPFSGLSGNHSKMLQGRSKENALRVGERMGRYSSQI